MKFIRQFGIAWGLCLGSWMMLCSSPVGASDNQEDAQIVSEDDIYELEGLMFSYDAWVDSPTTARHVAAMMKQFRQVDGLAELPGPLLTCRINYHDWPCRRKEVVGVNFATYISDVLPIPSKKSEWHDYLEFDNTPYNVFVEGPLPPPIPAWLLNDRESERSIVEQLAYERYSEKEGHSDSEMAALSNLEEISEPIPRSSPLIVPEFSSAHVEKAFRDDLWLSLEDFSSFAPIDRILFGSEVFSIVERLSEDQTTNCDGLCPLIRKRKLESAIQLFEYCTRRVVDALSTPPVQCTPIAFIANGERWLRTRTVLGVAAGGRGDGPMEIFRCLTSMSVAQAVSALDAFFKTQLAAETKASPSGAVVNLVAVSWKNRPSQVAKNRWEILYFDFWVKQVASPTNNLITAIDYKIPVYRLSDTKPASLDDGARPRDSIVRRFEHQMRIAMSTALAAGSCLEETVNP